MSALLARFLSFIFVLFTSIAQANVRYEIKNLEDYFKGLEPGYINYEHTFLDVSSLNNMGVVAGQYEYAIDRRDFTQGFVLDIKAGKLNLITDPTSCKWNWDSDERGDCNQGVDCSEGEKYIVSLNDKGKALIKLLDRSFLWSSNKGLQSIDLSIQPNEVVSALAMNNHDQVLLSLNSPSKRPWYLNKYKYFLWDEINGAIPITIKALIPKEYKFHPISINDKGQILFLLIDSKSEFPQIGFCLYEKGKLVQYHMPKRGTNQDFIPRSWNNKGDIVVNITTKGKDKAIVWSCDGKKIACDKDWVRNGAKGKGYPIAINDAQQIVGHLKISTYQPEIGEYENDGESPALWNPKKGWEELQSLVSIDSTNLNEGWRLERVIALNNEGQILVAGFSKGTEIESGRMCTFLLTPISINNEIP